MRVEEISPERVQREITIDTGKLLELIQQSPVSTGTIRSRQDLCEVPGVYLISTPEDRPVYIGRTRTKSIRGRIIDHCTQNAASDLRQMIRSRDDLSPKLADYLVRFLRIDDVRTRILFECFAIGVLKPPLNK